MLLQKSRIKWLNLGDGNNSFFFNQVKSNWHHNKIQTIKNKDGDQVFGHSEVAKVDVQYFQDSLGSNGSDHSSVLMHQHL